MECIARLLRSVRISRYFDRAARISNGNNLSPHNQTQQTERARERKNENKTGENNETNVINNISKTQNKTVSNNVSTKISILWQKKKMN